MFTGNRISNLCSIALALTSLFAAPQASADGTAQFFFEVDSAGSYDKVFGPLINVPPSTDDPANYPTVLDLAPFYSQAHSPLRPGDFIALRETGSFSSTIGNQGAGRHLVAFFFKGAL